MVNYAKSIYYLKRAVMLHILLVIESAVPHRQLLLLLSFILSEIDRGLEIWVHKVASESSHLGLHQKSLVRYCEESASSSSCKQL